jgi:hypothetical protein
MPCLPITPFQAAAFFVHSGIEVTKDYHLAIYRGALETAAKLTVELVFLCRFSLESQIIHTEERGILLVLQGEAHGHDAVGVTHWQIF